MEGWTVMEEHLAFLAIYHDDPLSLSSPAAAVFLSPQISDLAVKPTEFSVQPGKPVVEKKNSLFLDRFFQLPEGWALLAFGATNEPQKPEEHECPGGHPSQCHFGEVQYWLDTNAILCYDDGRNRTPSRTTS